MQSDTRCKKPQLEHRGPWTEPKIELNILLREKISAGLKECNTGYALLSKNKPKYGKKIINSRPWVECMLIKPERKKV